MHFKAKIDSFLILYHINQLFCVLKCAETLILPLFYHKNIEKTTLKGKILKQNYRNYRKLSVLTWRSNVSTIKSHKLYIMVLIVLGMYNSACLGTKNLSHSNNSLNTFPRIHRNFQCPIILICPLMRIWLDNSHWEELLQSFSYWLSANTTDKD